MIFFHGLSSEERNKHRPQGLSVCDLRKREQMKQLLYHRVEMWIGGEGINGEVDRQGMREDKTRNVV